MKNFKLLLATTAILSTGFGLKVMAVADTVSSGTNIEITPSVKIIKPLTVTQQQLKFGTIISPKLNDTVVVSNDPQITKATGSATLLTTTISDDSDLQRGILKIDDSNILGEMQVTNYEYHDFSIILPTEPITMSNDSTLCGTATLSLNNAGESIISDKIYFYYGGTFTITNENALPEGTCSGRAVVTVVRDAREIDCSTGGCGSN